MITREQAAEYVRLIEASHGPRDRRLDDARTIVALHDENATIIANAQHITSLYAEERDVACAEAERLRAEIAKLPATVDQTVNLLRLAEASVSLLRADLASTADKCDAARIVLAELKPLDHVEWTWPDDFDDPVGDKPECICAACGSSVSVERGMEWSQGRDVCSDCAQMRSEALSAVTRDRDAARLELRRLRAAEAPGTDDEAVAPWESVGDEDRPIWRYWWTPRLAVLVSRRPHGWAWFDGASWSDRGYIFAVDAMLAAERATASP